MREKSPRVKRVKKSATLPKHWTLERFYLNELIHDTPEYIESIEKGLPFFTLEELNKIPGEYPRGITWEEIDKELAGKGMIFKKATFRKYIQEGKIPAANAYRRTKTGREAVYPTDIISHINFIQFYYRVADNDFYNRIYDAFSDKVITSEEAIENNLNSSLLYTVLLHTGGLDGDPDINEVINQVFGDDDEFREKLISKLDEIGNSFDEKYDEFVEMLKNHKVRVSAFISREEDQS